MTAHYEFRTVWRVPATVPELTEILRDPTDLPRWWPSVYLAVDLVQPGGPDGLGTVAVLHTKGWLPYTLKWRLTVFEPMSEHGFAIRADGDLEGEGRWSLSTEAEDTVIVYDWKVRATKPLLRRLTWLMRPAFAANHRWAMARGEESLRLEIDRRRRGTANDDPGLPRPPGPTFRRRLRS